jgi:hypothetical protein
MGLSLRIDTDQGFADIEAFVARSQTVAIPRALNVLRDRAATTGFRTISQKNDIGPTTMRKYTVLKFATANDPIAAITVKGAGFPLVLFQPRQTAHGVSVRVLGRRFIVPHSFLLTLPNGHTGIFARGAYGGKSNTRAFIATGEAFGRFQFGKGTLARSRRGKRVYLAINELFTLAPADVFDDVEVTEAMQARVEADAADVLRNQIGLVR